ncbi:centrosomal protein CCDC61 [Nyctibius grandis]|uniref:centrosomal protein CCDC61 n=1 Tax=Nyctibius grandis TaxID=48427 RepID=UPI0035BBB5D0
MAEPRVVEAEGVLGRGGPAVRLRLAPTALAVEVEAPGTGERWRGEFDAAAIEELTRRTGNFKQFGVFCSMLEAALAQSSDAVSLELLTYGDLEALRSRKLGGTGPRPPPAAAAPLGDRRYLILVYSVEFDRIHYPLPLPPARGPDPAALWDELTRLRQRRDAEIRHLRDELQRALEGQRAAEAELLRERARHQRQHRQLAAELAEAKASERRLELRVQRLTAELATGPRGPRPQQRPAAVRPSPPSRESSGKQGHRPARSPSPAAPRPPRFDPTAFVRARQRRHRETQRQSQRRGASFGSASPATSRGRSSSADSSRRRRSPGSSGSEADERPQRPAPRGRTVTRTPRPLSASSCNSPGAAPRSAAGHKPPVGKHRSKENRPEEPLAEIDARLRALQDYMATLATRT